MMLASIQSPPRLVMVFTVLLGLGWSGDVAAESFAQRQIPTSEISQVLAGQTSEARRSGRRLFSVAGVMDGRLWSAWASNRLDEAWIEFRFPTTRYITRMQIVTGHAMDPKAWKATRRLKELKLEYDGGERTIHLRDSPALVTLDFPRAIVTTRLRLSAVETYGHGPIAISEVSFHEPRDIFALKPELKDEIQTRIAQLSDGDARQEAVDRLKAIGAPALTWLMLALDQDDAQARHGALIAIAATETAAGIDPVADALLKVVHSKREATATELSFVCLGLAYLGSQRTPRAVEVAEVFAADPVWGPMVRRDGVASLAAAGQPAGLPMLTEALGGDPETAMAAMPGFANLGEPGVEALAGLAHGGDVTLRVRVAQALSHVKGRGKTLVEELAVDPDPNVRAQTMRTVGALSDPSLLVLAVNGTRDAHRNVQLAAIEALGHCPCDDALDRLVELADAGDSRISPAAVRALVGHGAAALPALVEMVLSPPNRVITSEVDRSLTVLGARQSSELTELLLPHIGDPAGQRVANLLATCGDPGNRALLDTMSEPGYARRVFYAHRALEARPTGAVKPIIEALASNPSDCEIPVVSRYISVLSASGDPSVVATLGRVAKDPRDRVRSEATAALRPFTTQAATDLLVAGLGDPGRDVREQAAMILGERRVTAAVAPLSKLVRDNDEIILRAIWALGKIGDKGGLTALHAALHHERAGVRQYACVALARIGDASSLVYLIKLIEDDDDLVRHQAIRAISQIE